MTTGLLRTSSGPPWAMILPRLEAVHAVADPQDEGHVMFDHEHGGPPSSRRISVMTGPNASVSRLR